MEVEVISRTVQKFNGESFYLCGMYFQHKGKRLHRAVWEYHHGEIPKGYHVHHVDGDRCNNNISNLTLLLGSNHLSEHMNDSERKAKSRKDIRKAIAAAPAWHGSEEGRLWHSERGKKNWEEAPLRSYVCSYCGKTYQTKNVSYKGNHFCHQNCRAAYRRRRLRNEG